MRAEQVLKDGGTLDRDRLLRNLLSSMPLCFNLFGQLDAERLAATFLGEVGDVRRFPTKHHFAAHTGTAPLEASSGQVVRHRLSRAGDRKLNHALYMMAMVQVRRPSLGQAYYRRKLAEGKSPREALRCFIGRVSAL
jgi:transposase